LIEFIADRTFLCIRSVVQILPTEIEELEKKREVEEAKGRKRGKDLVNKVIRQRVKEGAIKMKNGEQERRLKSQRGRKIDG
jgi:hypothetical protein